MPFGLAWAPSVFSSLMDNASMGTAAYAMCYTDDIIVFSETFEEHISYLEDVLSILKKAGLKLVSKCDSLIAKGQVLWDMSHHKILHQILIRQIW